MLINKWFAILVEHKSFLGLSLILYPLRSLIVSHHLLNIEDYNQIRFYNLSPEKIKKLFKFVINVICDLNISCNLLGIKAQLMSCLLIKLQMPNVDYDFFAYL